MVGELNSCALFGTFPLRARVPLFWISYYSHYSYVRYFLFALAIPMREVYCVGYTPRAWDPRSL